jgi:tRNA pseudouridine55 synthase
VTPKRGATGLSGILPIDKPAGMTSHDVVVTVRGATGEGRVGHAGTLDPAATGLLVVLVGPYTRLEPYLSGTRKTYEARIAFGTATDTEDADGEITDAEPVPDEVFDPHHAQQVLDSFLGESMQTPPAFSAIKVDGRVAHRAARSGSALALEPRAVTVTSAELVRIDADARTWDVVLHVSKGTYVRALARDVGLACETVAHLSALRRTVSGMLTLDDALPLDDALVAIKAGDFARTCADPLAALGLPVLAASAADVADGRALSAHAAPELPDAAVTAVAVEGHLHGIYRREADRLVPAAVVAGTGT